jgi:hypothetical protein
VSNAYDWVEQIFAELQEFSDRLTQYAKSEMDAILRKKVVAILTLYGLSCQSSMDLGADVVLALFVSLAGQMPRKKKAPRPGHADNNISGPKF